MRPLNIHLKKTALLVMDCQVSIVAALLKKERERLLSNTANAIQVCRIASIPIIYVVVQFREWYPEVSERNARFREIKESHWLQEGDSESKICSILSPQSEDVIVTKKRFSAFTGSDLQIILNAMEIETLVLTGVSTLGVVESTARFAFDMDYEIIVLSDCCADRDPKAHNIALEFVLPRVSTVCLLSDFESAVSV